MHTKSLLEQPAIRIPATANTRYSIFNDFIQFRDIPIAVKMGRIVKRMRPIFYESLEADGNAYDFFLLIVLIFIIVLFLFMYIIYHVFLSFYIS